MKTKAVEFYSDGLKLKGDVYLPEPSSTRERSPAVVMVNGYSGTRDQIVPDYAKVLAGAGIVAFAIDFRGFGGSEGEPFRIHPLEQVEDIRSGVAWLQAQDFVDPERVGAWGTSYGAGEVTHAAALDKNIKVVVAQVGADTGERLFLGCRNYAQQKELFRKLNEDRLRRAVHGKGERVGLLEQLLDPQSTAFVKKLIEGVPKEQLPTFSWDAIEKGLEFRPLDSVSKIAPRPLLLIGAREDTCVPVEGWRKMYESAGEVKRLEIQPITHYETYAGRWLEESSRLAREWFERHL